MSGRRRPRLKRLAAMLGWLTLAGCDVVPGCNERYESNLLGQRPDLNAVIGDRVWHDLDGNGIQGDGEPGLPGVTVRLSDGQVTLTAVDGSYQFKLPQFGTYHVDFVPPNGMGLTAPDAAPDAVDSDADAAGRAVVDVEFGERDLTVDAGMVGLAAGPPSSAEASGGTAPSTTTTTTTAPTPAPLPTAPGPHPLCALYELLAAASTALLPVDDAGELQAWVEANRTFYAAAAPTLDEPEAAAFRAMLGYYETLRVFHEGRGWNPRVDLADIALVPQPPGEAAIAVKAVLESRCGVVFPTDTPG
jgi:hypothetical protein